MATASSRAVGVGGGEAQVRLRSDLWLVGEPDADGGDLGVGGDRFERGAEARRDALAPVTVVHDVDTLGSGGADVGPSVAGDQPHRVEPRAHRGVERPRHEGAVAQEHQRLGVVSTET